MKKRDDFDFQMHAQLVALKYGSPGDVCIAKEGIKFGYALAIADATQAIKEANDRISEIKRTNNQPK